MNNIEALVTEAHKLAWNWHWIDRFGQDNARNRRNQAKRIARLIKINEILGFDPNE